MSCIQTLINVRGHCYHYTFNFSCVSLKQILLPFLYRSPSPGWSRKLHLLDFRLPSSPFLSLPPFNFAACLITEPPLVTQNCFNPLLSECRSFGDNLYKSPSLSSLLLSIYLLALGPFLCRCSKLLSNGALTRVPSADASVITRAKQTVQDL